MLGRAGLYEDSWSTFTAAGDKTAEVRAVKSCGSLSPDGTKAVGTKYRSDSDSRIDVIVVDLKTGAQTNLTNGAFGGYNAYPTWSPTGEWIVWGSNKDRSGATGFGATDLWRIRPDGTGAQKIVDGKALGEPQNFEAPDVQPARGLAPDPEPTREELKPVADAGGAGGTIRRRGRRGRARRPRLQARRGRRRDHRLRVGPRRRRRLRRRRRRAAAGHASPTRAPTPVAVQVTDAAGRVATATAEVAVANAAPAISGARVNDDDPASFTATVADAGRAGRA